MDLGTIHYASGNKVFTMLECLEKLEKAADLLSKSSIIPEFYRGNKHNVLIALIMAYRFDMDPTSIMYNTYIHKGKLVMSTSLMIALANNSGLFATNIKFRVENEGTKDLKVTAYAQLKKGDLEIETTVSLAMAEADGWTKNIKYRTMPVHMLKYRAATFLIRTHTPEVLSGLHTIEEVEDVEVVFKDPVAAVPVVQKEATSKADRLAAKLSRVAIEETTEEVIEEAQDSKQDIGISLDGHKDEGSAHNDCEDQRSVIREAPLLLKLQSLVATHSIPQDLIDKWLEKAGVTSIEALDESKLESCIKYIEEKYAG